MRDDLGADVAKHSSESKPVAGLRDVDASVGTGLL